MEKKIIRESVMNPKLTRPVLNEATGQKDGSWAVQVWHLGERNLNGRTYTSELAERLVKENKTTLCMDGHDNYMSEYANSMAYAFDPYIEDNYLCVHFAFIDEEYEKKITFCLDHNIPVGVSSVGYGSMDEKGVIDADTYELVRYFDFVQSPANETYVAKKDSTEDGCVSSTPAMARAEDPAMAEEKANVIRKAALLLQHENI